MVQAPLEVDVLLVDGTVAAIRRVVPEDLPALQALHDATSVEALRMRFFSTGRAPARAYVQHLAHSPETVAYVAEVGGTVVALATGEPVGPAEEEVAFLVAEGNRGQGLASLLLEHLAADARRRGVARLVAEVLDENRRMLDVFLDAGFSVERHAQDGVVHVDLDPRETPRLLAAVDSREARAEARSLRPLLHPASVAVVGARRDATGVGAAILRSIRASAFPGRVCVVHPVDGEVLGVPAYRTLAEVPFPVDLVVVAVPGEQAVATVADAGAAGAGAAVVVSSGFGERGSEGGGLQQELLAVARRRSLRLVGPNCLGLVVNDEGSCLNATFQDRVPPPGGLAVASQSGGVGVVLMDLAIRSGLGIGCFVSLGNKADVSGNDLLAAWRDDPAVTAAALHLESFGNARKFARLARGFSQRKPLLAVVGGRSGSSRVGLDAVFARAGVISCDSAESLVTTALVLAEQPRPRGRGLGVLSNAGGMAVLAADAAGAVGLEVPARSRGTADPADAGTAVTPEDLAAVAAGLLEDREVHALLVVLVATGVTDTAAAVRALVDRVGRVAPGKPVLVVTFGGVQLPAGGTPGITVVRSIDEAVGALARIERHEQWRAAPRDEPAVVDLARGVGARRTAARLLDELGEGFLPQSRAVELMAAYDLVVEGVRVVQQARHGVELAVGLVQDPTVGPLVAVAAGGETAELLDDRQVLLAPVTGQEAAEALRRLRSWPLLDGFRGSTPVDVASVARLVVAVGQLAAEVPEVAELDLDPVVVGPDGAHVVGVRLRLATVVAEPDVGPHLRPRL